MWLGCLCAITNCFEQVVGLPLGLTCVFNLCGFCCTHGSQISAGTSCVSVFPLVGSAVAVSRVIAGYVSHCSSCARLIFASCQQLMMVITAGDSKKECVQSHSLFPFPPRISSPTAPTTNVYTLTNSCHVPSLSLVRSGDLPRLIQIDHF